MRVVLSLFVSFIIFSCSPPSIKETIIGDWELTKFTDLPRGKSKSKPDSSLISVIASFSKDSVTTYNMKALAGNSNEDKYGWEIHGDYIILKEDYDHQPIPVYIQELNNKNLKVFINYLFMDSVVMVFEKLPTDWKAQAKSL